MCISNFIAQKIKNTRTNTCNLRMKGNIFNLIKETPISNIINDKRVNVFPSKTENKARISAFIASTQPRT